MGFLLYESGPSGAPGLYPRQRPPSGSVILIIAESLNLVLTTPDRGIPSNCLCLSAFGVLQRWRDGVWPALMVDWALAL